MSAKKELAKNGKNERSLIENVVELSKHVILTNHFKQRLRQVRALGSRLGCRLPTIDSLPVLDAEADNRIKELYIAIESQLKVRYTQDNLIIPKEFYLSFECLKNGYCIMETGHLSKNRKKVVLFLSDNESGFLETIKEGEIHDYDSVQNRLSECKSLLKRDRFLDILLRNYEEET